MPRTSAASAIGAPAAGPSNAKVSGPSGLGPRLFRVVMRQADDGRRKPLLVTVELADLHSRAHFGMRHIDTGQRDVLAQERRAHRRSHLADLGATDMDAVTV